MKEFWDAVHGFFVANGYVFELLLAETLFLHSFPRRRFFVLRLLGSLAVILAFSVPWGMFVVKTPATEIVKFLVYFVLFAGGVLFCTDVSVFCVLFASAFVSLKSA